MGATPPPMPQFRQKLIESVELLPLQLSLDLKEPKTPPLPSEEDLLTVKYIARHLYKDYIHIQHEEMWHKLFLLEIDALIESDSALLIEKLAWTNTNTWSDIRATNIDNAKTIERVVYQCREIMQEAGLPCPTESLRLVEFYNKEKTCT